MTNSFALPEPPPHRHRTLALAAMLHAFTHIYQVALLPLYLAIQRDFQLASVEQATLLVSAMMAGYFLPSFPLGLAADRFSRKRLLSVGLAINALGFIGLAFARSYPMALACVVVTGFGGSFFHPAATAMTARLFPIGTGRALGMLGIGASIGFFFGPLYAGWRAGAAGWRAPVLELGLMGLVAAGVFAALAQEDRAPHPEPRPAPATKDPMFPGRGLWAVFIATAFAFSLRDFAGSSMGSLGSLFLQQAHGFSLRETGFALSTIFLASAISNPLFGGLSDRGRLPWTAAVLVAAAMVVIAFPRLPRGGLIPALMVYGFFFMASYPIVEAALMQAVPDSVRGRVFGLFITVGGCVGNISHWIVGAWVHDLGEAAKVPAGYHGIYAGLACLIIGSLVALPGLRVLHRREQSAIAAATSPVPPASRATP